MKTIPVAQIQRDPEARLAFLQDFIGFTDDDWTALKDSVDAIAPHLPGLLDAIYDHLLSYDDTRRIFLGPRGEVDPNYLALRKEHLTNWALRTAGGDKASFGKWLAEVGRRHTGVAGEPGRVVPPRYMVALTSFVQSALLSTLVDALKDRPKDLKRMALAWNKMMMLQLEMFLKHMAPAWPRWDEA